MKIGRFIGTCLGITAAFGLCFAAVGMPPAQATPAAVNSICPVTSNMPGNTGDCNIEFILNSTGTLNMLVTDMSQPFDGSDDMLVGVVNQDPNVNITGIHLSGPGLPSNPLFGFDSDGICTYAPGNPFGNPSATPAGILSYCTTQMIDGVDTPGVYSYDDMGPDMNPNNPNTWANISANESTGNVNFTTPLLNGESTFFSLETAPSSSGLIGSINPPTATPEPGTLALLGLGLFPVLRSRFRK